MKKREGARCRSDTYEDKSVSFRRNGGEGGGVLLVQKKKGKKAGERRKGFAYWETRRSRIGGELLDSPTIHKLKV